MDDVTTAKMEVKLTLPIAESYCPAILLGSVMLNPLVSTLHSEAKMHFAAMKQPMLISQSRNICFAVLSKGRSIVSHTRLI